MRNAHHMLRPGMTALAAALAMTSTPLFAQDVAPAPADPVAPVISAPPPAVESASPAASAPAAALNIPKIAVDLSDAPAASSAEAAAAPVVSESSPGAARSAAVQEPANTSSSQANQASQPQLKAVPAAPAPAPAMIEGPAPESPLPTPPVAVAPPAPQAVAPSPVEAQPSVSDDTLPIAGGVLAALALAGGAFAFAGRKRRYKEEYREAGVAEGSTAAPEPLTLNRPMSPQPAVAYTPPAAMANTAGAALPTGFDLSRYGPHVQAAYRGPTPDNPSLSLNKRLKRARFYDQRERMAMTRADSRQAASQAPVARPARQPEFVATRRMNVGSNGFRPAYQS